MSNDDDEKVADWPDIPKISSEEFIDYPEPFEFTCTNRTYDSSQDAHHYHVEPIGEYGDLDFVGHKVLINDRERLCDKFEIVDGKVIITVYCHTGD